MHCTKGWLQMRLCHVVTSQGDGKILGKEFVAVGLVVDEASREDRSGDSLVP